MPDFKYWDDLNALKYSGVKNYNKVAQEAIIEMHRQVGDLQINKNGIAVKGLLIRHLILPKNIAGTNKVLEFIVKDISKDSYTNIMDQYRPCFQAFRRPELNRRITSQEYKSAINYAKALGLHRGFNT